MNEVNLGNTPPEGAKRDAVHVAVISVVAAEDLKPSQKVAVEDGWKSVPKGEFVGIVDPYRQEEIILKGESFWLCLFPGTTIGMQHHWIHPAFVDDDTKKDSEKWLHDYVKNADCPDYQTLLEAATGENPHRLAGEFYEGLPLWEIDSEYLHFNSLDAHGDIPPEFWDHAARS